MALQQRPEGSEGVSGADVWGKEISVEEREEERVGLGLLPDVIGDQVSFQSPAGSLQFSCHGSQFEEDIMH